MCYQDGGWDVLIGRSSGRIVESAWNIDTCIKTFMTEYQFRSSSQMWCCYEDHSKQDVTEVFITLFKNYIKVGTIYF